MIIEPIDLTQCKVTKQSQATGLMHTMVLPVGSERVIAWHLGVDMRLAQQAFPDLSSDQREFLMTGITAEEWDELFKEPPEEGASK